MLLSTTRLPKSGRNGNATFWLSLLQTEKLFLHCAENDSLGPSTTSPNCLLNSNRVPQACHEYFECARFRPGNRILVRSESLRHYPHPRATPAVWFHPSLKIAADSFASPDFGDCRDPLFHRILRRQ